MPEFVSDQKPALCQRVSEGLATLFAVSAHVMRETKDGNRLAQRSEYAPTQPILAEAWEVVVWAVSGEIVSGPKTAISGKNTGNIAKQNGR